MTISKQSLSFVEYAAQKEGLSIEDTAKKVLTQKAPTEFNGLAQDLIKNPALREMLPRNVALQDLFGFDEHEAKTVVKILSPSEILTEVEILARLKAESNNSSPEPT